MMRTSKDSSVYLDQKYNEKSYSGAIANTFIGGDLKTYLSSSLKRVLGRRVRDDLISVNTRV